jgi:hypothetical protein
VGLEEEDKMRTLVISLLAAVAILSAGTIAASAMLANGAAIAHIGQQVDTVLSVKTKKPKTRTTGTRTPPPPREPSQSY